MKIETLFQLLCSDSFPFPNTPLHVLTYFHRLQNILNNHRDVLMENKIMIVLNSVIKLNLQPIPVPLYKRPINILYVNINYILSKLVWKLLRNLHIRERNLPVSENVILSTFARQCYMH